MRYYWASLHGLDKISSKNQKTPIKRGGGEEEGLSIHQIK